jgi:integrase
MLLTWGSTAPERYPKGSDMATKLTAVAVQKKFKPGTQRREILDALCKGLYLVIEPTGYKSWALRFRRPNGKFAKLHLGPVDFSGKEPKDTPVRGTPLTLSGARALAAEVHRQRQRDRDRDVVADYVAERRRQRAVSAANLSNTFGAAAKDFVEQYAVKKIRRWPEIARLLGFDPNNELAIISGGLAARWADKPLAQIDAHDIHLLIEETRRSGAPGLQRRSDGPTESRARAMLSCLSKLFGWLVQHRRVDKNPCIGVHRPETPKQRDRALTDTEIISFWRACDQLGEPFGQALKLLLLTGCRLNEVAGMRRDELSEDGAIWTIPGERTKNHLRHIVPLPPMARDLIKSVKPIAGGYVFTTTGKVPVSIGSKIKGRLDAAMKAAPWRLHDLRRTAALGMASITVPPHVIEAALNHISGAKAGGAGTYNVYAYEPEKKSALERWAAHIEGIVSDKPAEDKEKVVTFARKRGRK